MSKKEVKTIEEKELIVDTPEEYDLEEQDLEDDIPEEDDHEQEKKPGRLTRFGRKAKKVLKVFTPLAVAYGAGYASAAVKAKIGGKQVATPAIDTQTPVAIPEVKIEKIDISEAVGE